jgi:thiopurine S-methyltransferase
MREPDNNLDFWRAQWLMKRANLAAPRFDSVLAAHWPALAVPVGTRVLVPLAGQSPDLAWLAKKGFDPVGVEVSPVACEAFFAARGAFAERSQEGPFVCWKGDGVTLLQGDFFRLGGTFGAALDRGALVALPQAIRAEYAQKLIARLLPPAPILLVTVEYDPRRRVGPPFPVFSDEVRRLFPNAVVRARKPLKRARWDSVGGANSVVWFVRESESEGTTG